MLYWMQAAQRAEYNHALEYSIRMANKLKKPVIVFFGITESWPEANQRHYYFMLENVLGQKDSRMEQEPENRIQNSVESEQ